MVDVSDSKGGAVLVSIQPISSSNVPAKKDTEGQWNIVDEDPPMKVPSTAQTINGEDRYGFMVRNGEGVANYDPKMDIKKVREREQKWLKMEKNWKEWMEQKRLRVKERCRKGIPDSMRGRIWMKLSGGDELLQQNPGLFDQLVIMEDTDIVIHVIDKDLGRTFPSHVLFAQKGSQGQNDLRLVLKAYAMYNVKTGYCQAMAPVAATLLMHMPAEHAFWCLVQICEQYLPGYYSPGLHAFQIDALILKDLLAKHHPSTAVFLDSKLPPTSPNEVNKGLDPVLYCTEWFMSMFSRTLPWPTVLRIWDMFFFEGVKVLFKVALTVLSLAFQRPKDRENCPGFFEVTQKLRNLPIEITHEDVLIPEVIKCPIHFKDLKKEHFEMADIHFSEERARTMELEARRATLSKATSKGPNS